MYFHADIKEKVNDAKEEFTNDIRKDIKDKVDEVRKTFVSVSPFIMINYSLFDILVGINLFPPRLAKNCMAPLLRYWL